MSAEPGEVIAFSLSAQVYALDKSQKWTPLTGDVVPVFFYHNDSTKSTRIFAKEGDKVIVNSVITANMQYRRPSETFVQWFDSQHILYGLNLTSVADAEGFEREFEYASGKRSRPNNGSSGGGTGGLTKSVSGMSIKDQQQQQHQQQQQQYKQPSTIPKSTPEEPTGRQQHPQHSHNNSNNSKNVPQKQSKSAELSKATSNEQLTPSMTKASLLSGLGSSSGDVKAVGGLKVRIKELELQILSFDAERSSLNETIASQSKTISGLQNQIKQLETDLDKLKNAFQQNASNVNIWKQQLQTYQEVNETLSAKINELNEIYEKFGEILRRDE